MRFAENWQISVGDAFILNGVICIVDEVGDEHGRVSIKMHGCG